MADFNELKSKGNDHFKNGQFELALEYYSKALDLSPSDHAVLSNRSLTLFKLDRYESALEEANKCISANKSWAKGYARKAVALNALGRHKEAKEVCIKGFVLQDQTLCNTFVEEWLKAGRSLVDSKFDPLKKPPWSDIVPEATDQFCDEYCDLLYTVTLSRLSDAQSMSHDQMIDCVMKAVKIAENVLAEFHHPPTTSLRGWAEAATIRFESRPKSEWGKLMDALSKKLSSLVEWLKNNVHKSLRQVLDPVIILALSALLVRGNVLCQAYTGHYSTEYIGLACVGLFEQEVLTGPVYTAFHMAVLSCILNSYRLRGALSENEVEVIRGICHKLENLLHHLPKDHKNYQPIVDHYQHTVKLFREICAKVITGFTGSHDPSEALSELELALLKCEEKPDLAMDTAVKYLTDFASKTNEPGHINISDVENVLYITGILAKLNNHSQALSILHNGENVMLSLMATMMKNNILSLDELPAFITNCRKFAMSGAIWLKDHFPDDAASVFIHWKSFFTELRAILIQLGLRDCYREAFKTVESYLSKQDGGEKHQVHSKFQEQERLFFQQHSLHIISALHDQNYDAVAQTLQKSDVVLDYIFKIYDPVHHNPPRSQACVVVIRHQQAPMILSISDAAVYELIQKWPEAIYKSWYSQEDAIKQISIPLSDILFPESIRKILLDPAISRVFICPDVDLMCLPIDQLPIQDDSDGSSLPLYERVSVSLLSSPRELLRDLTVKNLQASLNSTEPNVGSSGQETNEASSLESPNPVQSTDYALTQTFDKLQLKESSPQSVECYIVANPDYKLEIHGKDVSPWEPWLQLFGGLLGTGSSDSHTIPLLKGSQTEAEAVQRILSTNKGLKVQPLLVQDKATMSAVLGLDSPHLLHLATHGYTSKQENSQYHGNFWADESCGILLAGAQTFLDKKFNKMDPKAGTGHMNAMAMCGMSLEGTCLVFVTACDSSVGTRPTQEMTDSITQAIRAAGSHTVISTLWAISDNEITEFASHFYQHLMTVPHCRPSEALSYAKVMMKQKGQSMYYWGAYVCHGLDNPII